MIQYFGRANLWVYANSRPESIRSVNPKNCTTMATDQEFVKRISGVKYRMKVDDKTKPKSEDKNKAKITSNIRALSKT